MIARISAITALALLALPSLAWASGPDDVMTPGVGVGPQVVFWIFAAGVIVGALVTVTRKNAISAVMALVATFFALAGLYTLLSAHFLAAIQVLVYAGAIMTLFIFVVMLLNREDTEPLGRRGLVSRAFGTAVTAGLFVLIGRYLYQYDAPMPQLPPADPATGTTWGGVASVGNVLFRSYVFPFEAISLMLLVAVIGAIVVARIPRRQIATPTDQPLPPGVGVSTEDAAGHSHPGGH